MRNLRSILCTLSAVLLVLSGCQTQSYAPSTAGATRELKITTGEEIRVVTTRRERLSFRVTEARADRLIGVTVEPRTKERRLAGETVEVPFDELAVLEVTRFAPGAAVLAVVIVGALGAVFLAAPVPPPVMP